MSVLINLLPDVRQARIRSERSKRTAASVTFLICGGVLVVVAILGVVVGGQRAVIGIMSSSIKIKHEKLVSQPNIQEAYNAQQHLAALPALYADRAYLSQFFEVLQQSMPNEIVISTLNVAEGNLIQVTGSARTYSSAAKFAKSLRLSGLEPTEGAAEAAEPRFTNVTLETASGKTGERVSFTMTAQMSGEVIRGRD